MMLLLLRVWVREEGVVFNKITTWSSAKTRNRYEIFYTQFFVPECLKNLLNILGSGSRIDNVKALNEGDHSFFLCFFRVFMGKNAFGFCLQTEILSFWYFVNFLMRRQKSPVQKGVIQPSFCTPGKIFAWSPSFNLSSTWPCVFYRVEISSFAEHSGTKFLLR